MIQVIAMPPFLHFAIFCSCSVNDPICGNPCLFLKDYNFDLKSFISMQFKSSSCCFFRFLFYLSLLLCTIFQFSMASYSCFESSIDQSTSTPLFYHFANSLLLFSEIMRPEVYSPFALFSLSFSLLFKNLWVQRGLYDNSKCEF